MKSKSEYPHHKHVDSEGEPFIVYDITKNIRVYESNGEYTIANHFWMPGVYASFEAAIKAVRSGRDGDLNDLWERLNPVLPTENIHLITIEDLETIGV